MSDLIDRQAVIDLLKQMRKDGDMVPWEGKDVFARIRKLPTIQPEKAQLSQEYTTSDTISRQAALDIFDDYNISVENGELEAYRRDRKRLCELPSVQPEYEPVKAEDFAKTMSENTLYNFMAWHNVAFTLMNEMGFVICKKTI